MQTGYQVGLESLQLSRLLLVGIDTLPLLEGLEAGLILDLTGAAPPEHVHGGLHIKSLCLDFLLFLIGLGV